MKRKWKTDMNNEGYDPVCDDVYAICGVCHYRTGCDYLENNEMHLCATVINAVESVPESNLELNARLEECFERMIRKAGIPVL